ncbi:MAG: PD-(D/E)XK nuclease family protein, partial [Bdellovibrionota bacterium]
DGILINSLSSGKADQAGSRYQSGNPDWSKQLPEEELLRPIKPKEYRPVLKSAGSNRDRMLPKKTATNKVFSLKDLLLPSSQSAEFGVAVHALFEKVKWIDDFDVTGFLTTQNLALRTLSAEMLKGYFKKAIENSKISELLSKQRYLSKEAERLKVYTEKPFAFRMKGRIISGIIDRLVVGFNGDKVVFAEIIDFKTSNTENIEIGALVESYRDQMQDYKLAVAREFKLEESLIKAVLAFVGSGEVCEV